jgi:hypothetical protein
MVKHRIDVYLSTDSLMYVRQLKEKWKRKNYSQTLDHMVKSYISLLEEATNVKITKAEKEKKEVDALTKLEEKWGVMNTYGNDRK